MGERGGDIETGRQAERGRAGESEGEGGRNRRQWGHRVRARGGE